MTVNVCAYVYARLSKHFAAQAPIQAALYLPRTARGYVFVLLSMDSMVDE